VNELLVERLESIREDIGNLLVDIRSEAVVLTVSREDVAAALRDWNWNDNGEDIVDEQSNDIDKHVDGISDEQLQQIARKMGYILQEAYWDALDEAIQRVMGKAWIDAALYQEVDDDGAQ
jgi:hypothetical protein